MLTPRRAAASAPTHPRVSVGCQRSNGARDVARAYASPHSQAHRRRLRSLVLAVARRIVRAFARLAAQLLEQGALLDAQAVHQDTHAGGAVGADSGDSAAANAASDGGGDSATRRRLRRSSPGANGAKAPVVAPLICPAARSTAGASRRHVPGWSPALHASWDGPACPGWVTRWQICSCQLRGWRASVTVRRAGGSARSGTCPTHIGGSLRTSGSGAQRPRSRTVVAVARVISTPHGERL